MKKQKPIQIKKSKEGSLRKIAARDGGLKSNGEISRQWMRQKMNNPRTRPSTKKKINFALNMSK